MKMFLSVTLFDEEDLMLRLKKNRKPDLSTAADKQAILTGHGTHSELGMLSSLHSSTSSFFLSFSYSLLVHREFTVRLTF
mmetsp:Transcript_714/g.1536  ORF Transcript_714/g.1536 Transcript_714/m.1536 type:complete len:80 (+) Transcript_714:707-946(+)